MPALAPQEELEAATRRAPSHGARSVSSRNRGAQRRGASEPRVLAPQQTDERENAPRENEQHEVAPRENEERPVRKRAVRRHREARVSLVVGFFLFLIFAQACALLFLKGMAVTATHRAEKLGDATSGEIGRVNDDIALTQKQIAALGSPAQIQRWADAKGWKMASPQSFDDIRQTTPPPENTDTTATDNGIKR